MGSEGWISLTGFPVPGLKWARDLIYFDGALLSEFRSSNGDTYLFHWCDLEDRLNRWMVFRVTRPDLVKYLHRRLTLRHLISDSQNGFVYIVDIGEKREFKRVFLAPLETVPDEFLPEPDSLFVFSGQRDDSHSYAALIDKDWQVEDLAQFPRRFTEVYSFLYLLGDSDREAPRSTYMFRYDFDRGRGWTARHFFRELATQIPKPDRPGGVEEFRYHSPGFISLKMNPKLGATITAAVNRYVEDRAAILVSYKILYDFVNDRSDFDDDDAVYEPGGFADVIESNDYVAVSMELCRRLGYVDWDRIYKACNDDVRAAARVLLMYCRRLKILAEYQAAGKVELL